MRKYHERGHGAMVSAYGSIKNYILIAQYWLIHGTHSISQSN